MDMRVLMAALALSAAERGVCGLAPAIESTRRDLVSGLKAADFDVPGRKRLWGGMCWWWRRFHFADAAHGSLSDGAGLSGTACRENRIR
jgi:hypothetical protein